MWSRSECGSAETVQRLPINLQLYLSWGGWGLRTDAAECDTHFYVLSTSGIFLDTVCGDNGTDYTVGDDLYNWYFIIHRTIIVHDESVVVWDTLALTTAVSEMV